MGFINQLITEGHHIPQYPFTAMFFFLTGKALTGKACFCCFCVSQAGTFTRFTPSWGCTKGFQIPKLLGISNVPLHPNSFISEHDWFVES